MHETHKMMLKKLILPLVVFAAIAPVQAAIFNFDIAGRATPGLSGPNMAPANSSPATGTELSPGIFLDDSTHQLSLNFGWGSAPAAGGGTDLTGDFTRALVQGPANPNGTTTGGILYDISADLTDLGNNGRTGLIDMSKLGVGNPPKLQLIDHPNGSDWTIADQEAQIENGQWYVSVVSSTFIGGEIRGQLTPVPEPREYAMVAGLALLGFAAYRRHKFADCK